MHGNEAMMYVHVHYIAIELYYPVIVRNRPEAIMLQICPSYYACWKDHLTQVQNHNNIIYITISDYCMREASM